VDLPSFRYDDVSKRYIQYDPRDESFVMRTNDYGGRYARGKPIPVVIEVRALGANDVPRDAVIKHPQVWLWIDDNSGVWGTSADILKIESPLQIDADQTWRLEFDFTKCIGLEPGTYKVAVALTDPGGWLGTLRSNWHHIEITAPSLTPR
jgi:hypothetical protein